MATTEQDLDVLLCVPFQPLTAYGVDPQYRQTLGAHLGAPLGQAMAEFEQFLGRPLDFRHWRDHPLFHGSSADLMFCSHRSLTAVTLATHLEEQGLNWSAIDPAAKELRYWRRCFERLRRRRPRVVALSTSFVMSGPWLKGFCSLVRRVLPDSKLLVGGTYYITSARQFLGLDADVFCIGEGEQRLPQIVAAIRDGRSLDGIPGIYQRREDGTLTYSGPAAPLKLDELAPVDWSLAKRIEPFIDLENEPSYFYVETQRGCPFRCAFCTYHTLTHYEKMSVDNAVESILRTGVFPRGYTSLVDATATFPRKRWRDILSRLIERGGSPHPILAFARVTDIDDEIAQLMARAGVQEIFVGQESGDQRMLDAMNKRTRAEEVPAAVRALGNAGVGAQFCFIHGFPGETAESLQTTRSMLMTLNRGFETRPVVYTYVLTPFHVFDFATISRVRGLAGVRHPVGYESADFSPRRAGEEVLATLIAGSRVPHAPVCSFLFDGQAHFLFTVSKGPRRYEIFRWLKALERGVAIFLERELEGKTPIASELHQVRATILAKSPARSRLRSAVFRTMAGARAKQTQRARSVWAAEQHTGPGLLTKSFMAFCTYRDFGRFRDAVKAWKTGAYAGDDSGFPDDGDAVEKLSTSLIENAMH